MKKNYLSILLASLLGFTAKSQTVNIPLNGSVNVNGVNISSSFTGDVNNSVASASVCNLGPFSLGFFSGTVNPPPALDSWAVTLNFDHAVNDLVFLTGVAYPNVSSFTFTSNNGSILISPMTNSINSPCRLLKINGNKIYNDPFVTFGADGGAYKIHSSGGYTTLTITGKGIGATLLGLTSSSVLAVNDINLSKKDDAINIYPNPVKNNFTISSKEGLKSYKIFDESGREISSSLLKGTQDEVNMSSALPGNYTIMIETEKQKITKKLLKQ